MFNGASLFNQSLEDWDVSSVKNMSDMFIKSPMTNNLPSWYVP
ncbi:MAG: BspA family leucine-rich repeat surface protein [Pseudobacteriovorax sp.]|nr:BspA family leucine-rich repeat surface protein [Pseudobacteriovorax sp.]